MKRARRRAIWVTFCVWIVTVLFASLLYLKAGAALMVEPQFFARIASVVLLIVTVAVIILMSISRAEILHAIDLIRQKIPDARGMISHELVTYTLVHTAILAFFAWTLSGYLLY